MNFVAPLLWTSATLADLQTYASQNNSMTLQWFWAPFHEAGFKALKFAAREKISTAEFTKILDDLSCPGDARGALLPLDPAPRIRSTWSEAGEDLQFFKTEGLFLPSISLLKKYLNQTRSTSDSPDCWTPVLSGTDDHEEMSRWLAKNASVLKRFHDLDPWSQLELIENVKGVVNSSSNLHFRRVYSL